MGRQFPTHAHDQFPFFTITSAKHQEHSKGRVNYKLLLPLLIQSSECDWVGPEIDLFAPPFETDRFDPNLSRP